MTELVRYEAAYKALVAAKRVDEVKDIRDKAIALRYYGRQAKDRRLIATAVEIQKRAERRLGEMLKAQGDAGKMAKGAREKGIRRQGRRGKLTRVDSPTRVTTLADQGISKDLADRSRKAAALPSEKFEAEVAKAVSRVVAASEGNKAVIKEARAEQQKEKKAKRAKREEELASKIAALPDKKYGVIVADPEWKFVTWSEDTGMDRAAANHYPVSALGVIKSRPVQDIAADDCVLFLWTTIPMLRVAMDVMEAWGFKYKSNCIWAKDSAGTGYWFRERHEQLLIGVRGKVPCPAPGRCCTSQTQMLQPARGEG